MLKLSRNLEYRYADGKPYAMTAPRMEYKVEVTRLLLLWVLPIATWEVVR